MAFASRIGLAVVVALAIGLQYLPLRNIFSIVQIGLGIGKHIQPIADFPYQCRRIDHPLLKACEDMWLSESTRELYLACSDSHSRAQWFPSVAHYNLSGRFRQDAMVVLDVDQAALASDSEPIAAQRIKTPGFSGTAGDGLLSLVGFTGLKLDDGGIRLLVINNRPSIDPKTGALVENQASVGGNATIEVFERARGRSGEPSMDHMLTIAHPNIATPNRVAAVGTDSFYITNDHGKVKTGELARLAAMLGKGDVAFCSYTKGCDIVSSGHAYPNGLSIHTDGRLLVPNVAIGRVFVYQPQQNGSLETIERLDISYGLDNLSEDQNGDIWGAGSPQNVKMLIQLKNPAGATPPAVVIRIRKAADVSGGYTWEKILEDRDGEVLPGATTVVHDARTGRLFLSGVADPFITVCNPK